METILLTPDPLHICEDTNLCEAMRYSGCRTVEDEKLRTLYGEIMRTESMTKFNEAKTAMDELMNDINAILTMTVNGEDPATCDPHAAGCSGNCSSCGGCH